MIDPCKTKIYPMIYKKYLIEKNIYFFIFKKYYVIKNKKDQNILKGFHY